MTGERNAPTSTGWRSGRSRRGNVRDLPEAPDLRTFWSNIIGGVDCTSEVLADRWRIEDYYDPDPTARRGQDLPPARRFHPDVEFDPLEFGLPPNSLEVTDVAQLLSLIAKEVPGCRARRRRRGAAARTAVVLGVEAARS